MTLPLIFTVDEVAERFGVERQAVLRRLQARKWPHHKDGRIIYFTQEDINEIIELAKQPVVEPIRVIRRGVR